MLSSLKFVQGAIAKKDFLPALTHFHIHNGTVRGYNGKIAICSPIALDINCKPKGEELVRAIASCDETVQLSLTKANRLSIKSGRFKALIECVEEDTPLIIPEGGFVEINGERLYKAFEVLSEFIGDDASRPWNTGMLLKGDSAYATCNVVFAQFWIGGHFPKVINIPYSAIYEVLRVKEPPSRMQLSETNVTFHYNDGRWIRSQLLSADWPDIQRILDKPAGNQQPIDAEFFEGLEILKPFCDKKMGTIIFKDGVMSTHDDPEKGATYDIPNITVPGRYRIEILQMFKKNVNTIDWSQWPAAGMFFGDSLRGAFIGLKA